MSHSGSEDDIWDYKPLKKTKKRSSQITKERGTKRRKDCKPAASLPKAKVKLSADTYTDLDQNSNNANINNVSPGSLDVSHPTGSRDVPDKDSLDLNRGALSQDKEPQSGAGFCPVCQMPFSILVVQSQQWHVAECLDTPADNCKECPDGLQCTSSIPNHYKRYSHSLLAQSRAVNDCMVQAISDFSLRSVNAAAAASGTKNVSASSSQSSSLNEEPRGTPTKGNALLLLRSPNTEDIKKKKGWSPSINRSQSQNSSQEARLTISTPVETHFVDDAASQTETSEVKEKLFESKDDNDYISYSPLSELPGVDEEHNMQSKKSLFHSAALQEVEDDSLKLFSDEDDDLFLDVLDQYDHVPDKTSLDTCENLQTDCHLSTSRSTGVSDGMFQNGPQSVDKESTTALNSQIQSPQSLVLERLRERVSDPVCSIGLSSCYDDSAYINQELSSTQTERSIVWETPSPMAPLRSQTKAGPSGLKQTDIGVFFGLKPLSKNKTEEEVKAMAREVDKQKTRRARISEGQGEDAKCQGRRRRKSKASSEVSNVSSAVEDGTTRPMETEGRGGGRVEGRKRWNRGRATDGDPEEPRRCPFYKKIPGTGFTVDAFQYGLVEGVTAYFLTHFHSDHYSGLKKDSVFPIYCNNITGNLVKSKLKVDKQYVHVLPMNTECIVQGVKVTLLDANHCPGAAMLLFVLPDGQTVLHTGDFRADPSMERYPELQPLSIKTLYLDTTYCSPEYTFPTQQEVITFAVNTAFEQVTLNPRTLVVCGTYAIGKEKVFLAVAEVLGSKVCLSKDKYNTMCCLESAEIGQRITTDWQAAQVHVLPMMQLNFKNLRTHLNKFSRKYDQLVAFKPTGWTFNQTVSVEDIQPQTQGNISIYGVPYSEHSSFLELKRFVQWLRPKKIIPTVNVGSWRSRKAMDGFFNEWQTELRNLSATPAAVRSSNCGAKQ